MDAPPISLADWLWDAYATRALQRVEEISAVAPISRGEGPARALPEDLHDDLGAIELEGADGEAITLDRHLETSGTEALIALKDGAVVYERYRNGMRPESRHILFSVTKSVCASTLGIAVGRGDLAVGDRVGDIASDLAGTTLGDATVQQVIDMTAGIDFVEAYDQLADPETVTPAMRFFRQSGLQPLAGDDPVGAIAMLGEFGSAYPHGERFEYRTPLTCAMGHILEAATGRPWAALAAEVWTGIGAEHDAAVTVDVVGQAFAGGGMLATLRDLARYGQMHLEDGAGVVPASWVADTRNGTEGTRRAFDLDPYLSEDDLAQWDEYRNAFWVVESGRVYEALGIFGQVCRVNQEAGTVIARFCAHSGPSAVETDYEMYRAHDAIEAALS